MVFKWFLIVIITISIFILLMTFFSQVVYFYCDIFVHSMNFIMGKKQQFVLEQLNFDLQVTSWYFFPLKKLLIWWVKCQGKNSHPILNLANLIFLNINDILRFDFFKIRFCFFNRGKDFFFSSKECVYLGILSVQFSHSVMSDSLWPHGLQHARPPCPLPTPGAYSN